MRFHRLALSVLAAAVCAGLVLLWVASRGESEPAEVEAAPPAEEAKGAPVPSGSGEATSRAPRPELEPEKEVPEEDLDVRRHVRSDGTRTRDHRAAAGEPSEKEGPLHVPLKIARVESDLVLGVRRAMRPIVKQCADRFPEDLGEVPRLQGELGVSVRGGELQVVDANIQLFDVHEGQIDVCVQSQVLAITLPAPEHQEVGRHVLTYPFRLD